MFGPLSFPSPRKDVKDISTENSSSVSTCLLCERKFNLVLQQDDFLQHIFDSHKLVIADVPLVANLERYVSYWRMRMKDNPLKEFCSTVFVDVEKEGKIFPNEKYFLLSDVLPEDRQLREGLQQQRLEWALEQQKVEREDNNFSRGCLFCTSHICGTRALYLDHLASQHNLQLGHPHNLVFIDELINKLHEKIERLQCFYCEKVFKDRNVLKEHMRKKSWHKRINPENKEYDRFYIVNYLEAGKTWKEHQGVEARDLSSNEDAEWSDWTEDTGDAIVCLLCHHSDNSWDDVNTHMLSHGFHYEQLTNGLDFYQQVKLVNYIRRQVHRLACIICDEKFESSESLLSHMTQAGHLTLPHCLLWDQPEYYFPTYENDLFLCQIEDSKDAEEEELKEKLVSKHLTENKELIEQFQKLLCDL
ncbi:zinc finger protein 277-like [Macrosteles quadrilineatus]|uniref:zinc finger protein 277-like n=1 Tax=Macrosteles quadrilineatus TaxID=74068 RepID=UPI0023E0B684|nr:zinc finger protein 277-like [Macrosteles quadrilineatus]